MAVNESKKDEITIGSEIIEVNGKSTEEYIRQNVAPFISTSSPHILRKLSMEWLLRGIDGDKYEIKFRTPDGRIKSLSLVHSKSNEKNIHSPVTNPTWGNGLFNFKWFDNQIAYVALNSLSKPQIDTLFKEKIPELKKNKRFSN
ncbi:MAG: hypothetical protein KKF62_16170 [Bacteroidetes bacterium]|nr:hypothetical protein [Bacteroidota bacterium]MBU1115727.1 hypothetical protein [Bacteroidota bacterium]MBU1800524.1 hypothetical protein [Bacteroidota bacterium]